LSMQVELAVVATLAPIALNEMPAQTWGTCVCKLISDHPLCSDVWSKPARLLALD
jgi:hypothetical protein